MRHNYGARIFNQFTFFSVLVPGLFAIGFLLPLAPTAIFELDAGWVIVLVAGLSFVIGMTLHIVSETFEEWAPGLTRPTVRLTNALDDSDPPEFPDEILRAFIGLFDEQYGTDLESEWEAGTDDTEESRVDSDYSEQIFQATLTELWSKNVGPIRILVTTYFLCRSMALLIPLLAVTYLEFGLLRISGVLRFEPTYLQFSDASVFFMLALAFFVLAFVSFHRGYNRYAQYTVDYLITGFLQINDIEG